MFIQLVMASFWEVFFIYSFLGLYSRDVGELDTVETIRRRRIVFLPIWIQEYVLFVGEAAALIWLGIWEAFDLPVNPPHYCLV